MFYSVIALSAKIQKNDQRRNTRVFSVESLSRIYFNSVVLKSKQSLKRDCLVTPIKHDFSC